MTDDRAALAARPYTKAEVDAIRAEPIANRNGGTIDRVDRLIATLDRALALPPPVEPLADALHNALVAGRLTGLLDYLEPSWPDVTAAAIIAAWEAET